MASRPDSAITPCRRCGGEKEKRNTSFCSGCKVIAVEQIAEKARARSRRWRRDNPRRFREQQEARARRNPRYWEAAQRRLRERYPDFDRVMQQRRRAMLRAAFVENVEPLVLLERDDGLCGICGEDVDPLAFDVDHVIPLSRGGQHSYANTQIAHPVCNRRKWAKTPKEVAA